MTIIPSSILSKATGLRMFDLTVTTTGWLDGELSDWPANIQEPILEALEKMSQQVQLPLAILHSRCDIDYGGGPDGQDQFYIQVIASEIVVADSRFYKDEHAKLREQINQLLNNMKGKIQ